MTDFIINKVNITAKAEFDYEHCLVPKPKPSWKQVLKAVGCNWDAVLIEAGYDIVKIYKNAGFVWELCLEKAGGNRKLARQEMAEARERVNEKIIAIVKRATNATRTSQVAAFKLAEIYCEIPSLSLGRELESDKDNTPYKTFREKLIREAEEYITLQNKSGLLLREHYFRCKIYDDALDKYLMLFFYRKELIAGEQNWDLAGICYADDWSEAAEEEGLVRNWLKSEFFASEEDAKLNWNDWAVRARVMQIVNNTAKTKFENVLKEVDNEFECDRDKADAAKVAFSQSINFECARK